MPSLTVEIPEDLAAFLEKEAARPEHGSVDSVIDTALRLYRRMRSDPTEQTAWREAVLSAAVEGSPADETGGPEAELLRRLLREPPEDDGLS